MVKFEFLGKFDKNATHKSGLIRLIKRVYAPETKFVLVDESDTDFSK
tara:strand:- start:455 stop:595 length:141 start_codon:yes stop_codon:yes gene_type:complete